MNRRPLFIVVLGVLLLGIVVVGWFLYSMNREVTTPLVGAPETGILATEAPDLAPAPGVAANGSDESGPVYALFDPEVPGPEYGPLGREQSDATPVAAGSPTLPDATPSG